MDIKVTVDANGIATIVGPDGATEQVRLERSRSTKETQVTITASSDEDQESGRFHYIPKL